jgi:hypothetical protein
LVQGLHEPVVGALVLAGLDLGEHVYAGRVVHHHRVDQLVGVGERAAGEDDRRRALPLESVAERQEAVPIAGRFGGARPLEQIEIRQRHVEHQLVRQADLLARRRAGLDQRGFVPLDHRLSGEVREHARLVHVDELRAAEGGEHVADRAVADPLQGDPLVVTRRGNVLGHRRAGVLGDEPSNDLFQHLAVLAAPVGEGEGARDGTGGGRPRAVIVRRRSRPGTRGDRGPGA